MAKIQTLKNKENVIVYPQTHGTAVFVNEGEILQDKIKQYLTSEEVGEVENVDIAAELTSNKVTSIRDTSTDLQYPSAKAVYDFVNNQQIEIDLSEYAKIVDIPANEEDPTVPNHVKTITEENISNWNNKQEQLTAGANITIVGNVISSTGGGGAANILVFENKTVATTAWVEDTTYEEFGYKADISCAGVTDDFFSDVVFGVSEAVSGNYAPISLTSAGIVTIYAVELPSANITIPTILCSKGA